MPPRTAAPGALLDLAVRGRRGLAANFFALERDLVDAMVLQTFLAGEATREVARDLAPRDTGFMAEHIRTRYTPSGLAFEVGYDDDDFSGRGLPPYYWHQELGFTHWITGQFIRNPHLEPAYRVIDPTYRAGVRQAALAAISRVSARAVRVR